MLRRCLLSALVLSACAPESAAPEPHTRAIQAALEEQAWITAAPEFVAIARELAASLGQPVDITPRATGPDGVVVLALPSSWLEHLSELAHEQRGACGGFMLHDSEAEALAAIAPEPPSESSDSFLIAPAYTIDRENTVKAMMAEVDESGLLATIRKLSSYRNRFHTSMTGAEAAKWIHDTWKMLAAERDDVAVRLVEHQKTPQPSVELVIPGRVFPDEVVVLGGHLDSTSGRGGNSVLAPGADDNASGIAVLTEILRIAFKLGYSPDRTVKVYGYAAEEIGLVGSAEIAARAKAEKWNVVGVMQLDMTNYTSNKTPYIALIDDNVDKALTSFSVELIEKYLDFPWKYTSCGYACSDHASWTKNGFPSTFPNEATLQEGNKQIHTERDTLALSGDRATHSLHFARFGVAFLAELAKGALPEGECSDQVPCKDGKLCHDGVCIEDAPVGLKDCDSTADCPAGYVCVGKCIINDPCPGCDAGACFGADCSVGGPKAPTTSGPDAGVSSGNSARDAQVRDAQARDAQARDAQARDASRPAKPSDDGDEDSAKGDDEDDREAEPESEQDDDDRSRAERAEEGGCATMAPARVDAALALLLLGLMLRPRRKAAIRA